MSDRIPQVLEREKRIKTLQLAGLLLKSYMLLRSQTHIHLSEVSLVRTPKYGWITMVSQFKLMVARYNGLSMLHGTVISHRISKTQVLKMEHGYGLARIRLTVGGRLAA